MSERTLADGGPDRDWVGTAPWGVAIMAAAVAGGLGLFHLGVDHANIVMLLLLGVLFVSVIGGRWLGTAASVFGVLAFNFFFTEPRFTLVVNNPQYLITFPVMLAVALVTSELMARLRRQARVAMIREQRTQILYRTSRALLGAGSVDAAGQIAAEHLEGMLRTPTAFGTLTTDSNGLAVTVDWRARSAGALTDWPTDAHRILARRAAERRQSFGSGTDRQPDAEALAVPIVAEVNSLGVLLIDCRRAALTEGQRTLLDAVVAQLALAIDRERLSAAQEASRVSLERERLRNSLLQSVSHDLRSPLATIAGSASAVLLNHTRVLPVEAQRLMQAVVADATWLTDVVENLLSLTRVESGDIAINTQIEVAEEVVEAVVHRLEQRVDAERLTIDLPPDPVFMPMDVHLMQQVLTNLIDNAFRHGGQDCVVRVAVLAEGAFGRFVVEDTGRGFGADELRTAFERVPARRALHADQRRGLGLGLVICRAIVDAHGGTIEARNTPHGGACVVVSLPRIVVDVQQSLSVVP